MEFFNKYTYDQLAAMGKIYHSGKATPWQAKKYEAVRSGLLAELRALNPEAKDTGSACYIHAAIDSCLYDQRQTAKRQADQMRAAAQSARTQLKAWDWPGLK